MSPKINNLQDIWEERSRTLGNSKRSVLLKNIPSFINNAIHQQHLYFIFNSMEKNHKEILDVGCGYGRISQELLKKDISLKHIISNKRVKSQQSVMNELTKGKGTVDLFGNEMDFTSRKSY